MINKDSIKKLKVGDYQEQPTLDRNYVQRVRNYVGELKDDDHDYTVTYRRSTLRVTRIESNSRLTQVLSSMNPGEIMHPGPSTRYKNIHAVCRHIDKQGFKVTTVTQVEKI